MNLSWKGFVFVFFYRKKKADFVCLVGVSAFKFSYMERS